MLNLSSKDFRALQTIGLTPALAQAAATEAAASGVFAPTPQHLLRLTAVHRETADVHDGHQPLVARPQQRLLRALAEAGTALAVGDWVLAHPTPGVPDGALWLHARVPPGTHLVRRDGDGGRHPVVSNVDHALLVMGLDDDFNLRRIERYATLAHGAGITATVVLTKADIAAADPGQRDSRTARLAERLGAGTAWVAVDATQPAAAAALAHLLVPGRTLVLLGSSGAGKSTLTNTLLGHGVEGATPVRAQDTGPVRAHDSRGMHTTTSRSLHRLPGGACVIDTPGVRTLRADVDSATVAASFGDVAALAPGCRFRDCRHAGEPGCAVAPAVSADRLRNYAKLLREAERDNQGWQERRQQLAAWKSRSKQSRAAIQAKRGAGAKGRA